MEYLDYQKKEMDEFYRVTKLRNYIKDLLYDVPDNRLPEVIEFLEKTAVHSGPHERNILKELDKKGNDMLR